MIEIKDLSRQFRVLNRREGLKGAAKDLFSRDYRIVDAVKDVNMTIEDGEIIGYVGPNGAGKSTTIKMLCGILQPSSGTIRVNGRDPFADRMEHMRRLGVVFGQRTQLWWNLPVRESFRVLKDIYLVDDAAYDKNMKMFEDLVHIDELYNKTVRQMSLGQRMLCEVTAAFLHDPELVLLDEPTIGLDVAVKDSIRKLIRSLNEEKNATILLTSHDTSDIESLCRRVAVIDKGTLIFDGELGNLRNMFGNRRVIRLAMKTGARTVNEVRKLMQTSFPEGALEVQSENDGEIMIYVDETIQPLVGVVDFAVKNLSFDNISIEQTGLEEIIKKIYEGGRINEEISGNIIEQDQGRSDVS